MQKVPVNWYESFDFYKSLPNESTTKSNRGGMITIAAFTLIFFLIAKEVSDFNTGMIMIRLMATDCNQFS